MPFAPQLAAIRFGCGLSPVLTPPSDAVGLLDGLRAPDSVAERFPIAGFADYDRQLAEVARIRLRARKTGARDTDRPRIVEIGKGLAAEHRGWFVNTLLRWSWTEAPLRERLALFWADHFTARGKVMLMASAGFPYVEDAIRPNLPGRFADLLIAAVTHPLMLHFLDQSGSIGPNSAAAGRVKRMRGLNENLAREVLELHTLGVGGPYGQADVTQLAELFTGLTYRYGAGFRFRKNLAEPGAETVMGARYGGTSALAPIHAALRDLAAHPATAQHIARKLAVHFVADTPDPALVAHVQARYLATDGDLMAVYGALIEHPAAWGSEAGNVKPPLDFIASACRALAVRPEALQGLSRKQVQHHLLRPLALMGQPLMRPNGPDGWPEDDAAWVTPQAVSARLRWALSAPGVLCTDLPDPRDFVDRALGERATQPVRFAAGAAESRSDAIGLVLAAPGFQRR
ncbi:DUF1800 domain-containing protein [Sedimentitalea nanhaiensis]|uniref:Uncharacterized conserved protein, DUF1800 family n=1 Tax=Sedimentitalea nanhaiensis TaxID=999627 RepID=A0A1I7CEV1_9RHOB|nr:DUF1800 domain-containing protein [Sedimentitalea nanhaiensis]SFT97932.1 Uncharacterized conserved protein, DUF1800 family [Sedimentitalea nanhaiensis]